jgi:hypothetical protein
VITVVRDLDTGAEQIVGSGGTPVWSQNDGYLALMTYDAVASFKVFDRTTGKSVRVAGSIFGGWLDLQILYFTGNFCDTSDYFTVRADGSQLTRLEAYGEYQPQASQDGKRIAMSQSISAWNDRGVLILDRLTGETQTFPVGPLFLGFYRYGSEPQAWSPDGRYLAMRPIVGKGSSCTPQKTTIER